MRVRSSGIDSTEAKYTRVAEASQKTRKQSLIAASNSLLPIEGDLDDNLGVITSPR